MLRLFLTFSIILITTVGLFYLWQHYTTWCIVTVITVLIWTFLRCKKNLDEERRRGWRFGHHSRDEFKYEKRINGSWHYIIISGCMLVGGKVDHVVYLPRESDWNEFPDWAREDKEVILGRIEDFCRDGRYEIES